MINAWNKYKFLLHRFSIVDIKYNTYNIYSALKYMRLYFYMYWKMIHFINDDINL